MPFAQSFVRSQKKKKKKKKVIAHGDCQEFSFLYALTALTRILVTSAKLKFSQLYRISAEILSAVYNSVGYYVFVFF